MKSISKQGSSNTFNPLKNILEEKNFLFQLDHPFIMKLKYAFQTPTDAYLIMDFL